MVYFLANDDYNVVKIGVSKNIHNRLYSYNTHFPFELKLILTLDGNYKLEKFLHNKFKQSYLRNEWFKLSEEIHNFIKNPIIPVFNNDTDTIRNSVDLDKLISLYKEKKSNIEIANIMGISIHTVRRRIKDNKLVSLYRIYKCSKPKGYYKGQYQKRKSKT